MVRKTNLVPSSLEPLFSKEQYPASKQSRKKIQREHLQNQTHGIAQIMLVIFRFIMIDKILSKKPFQFTFLPEPGKSTFRN